MAYKGKVLSEEHKRKISKAHKRKKEIGEGGGLFMRKNIFWAMCFLFLWTKTLFAGFLIGRSIGTYPDTKNRQNPLVSGTTAAFSIYLTSTNVIGTTTGRWTMYASSFTLEQLNSNGGATTNYFNVLLSTSDTIFNCINRINEIPIGLPLFVKVAMAYNMRPARLP